MIQGWFTGIWGNRYRNIAPGPVNSLSPGDAYMRQSTGSPVDQIMTLPPVWWQAIIWTNDDILSTKPQVTHFSGILFDIQKFIFKKMHLKMSTVK